MKDSSVAKLGTAPVFFTAISTILGAILFLRFGYAVGHTGFLGTALIILLANMVTLPTAMAIAEIATNQKVEGGGEYFIISRSFGLNIGAAIGFSLFLSQAISVSFYIIAFSQSFDPILPWINEQIPWFVLDKRMISVIAATLLSILIVTKGAALGLKALYVVVAILFLSLLSFLMGTPLPEAQALGGPIQKTIDKPDSFFLVFAICFPAFTGMTAGVGLSGDLRNPRRSIPLGTMAATLSGIVVYLIIAWKLSVSATPDQLASDQLIMSRISLWGPLIPIGLAAATISSAIGSFLVAPRTLQALAADDILPWKRLSRWLGTGRGNTNEPVNASLVVALVGISFASMGDVNFVAQIISMFFMVTYGSICLISFLEHFAADPSYRPTFRSRWYISLGGAIFCLWLMVQMSAAYAILAVLAMLLLFLFISYYNPDKRGLSAIAQGVIFQISRELQVFLQKSRKTELVNWRPAIVSLSDASFKRHDSFDLLRWLSNRYGFGTYIHFIEGYLSGAAAQDATVTLDRLVEIASHSESNVYVDTIVSPSYTTAISQIVQLPGISGKENNMVLLEYDKNNPAGLERIIDNYALISATGFDVCILGSSAMTYGYHREIHIWLTPSDLANASLMILIAYILLGHPDWSKAVIRIFSLLPREGGEQEKENLINDIRSGRLPISENNVEFFARGESGTRQEMVQLHSRDADLIIVGFRRDNLKHRKDEVFSGYDEVGNILFVNTESGEIDLVDDKPEESQEAINGQEPRDADNSEKLEKEKSEKEEPIVEKSEDPT